MTTITTGEVKGLFYHLVKAVGGSEAAAAYLGVSQQRISQLQNVRYPDMPTVMHIVTLEHVVGQDLVTGFLSRAAAGESTPGDVMTEACEATEAAVNVQKLARTGAPRRELREAATELHREAADLIDTLSSERRSAVND